MVAIIKMLGISAFLAIPSLAIPFSGTNMAWVNDAGYSFFLQVALPHLGVAASSVIGSYAGVLFLRRFKDKNLHELAVPVSVIAIVVLISGFYIADYLIIFLYTLACPPLIGAGVMKLSERLGLMTKPRIVLGLIALLILPSIALVCVGISSTDWVMIIDLGTGLRVMFGALIGGLVAHLDSSLPAIHDKTVM
ncbi:hypothetical protein ACVR2T_002946 [Cronobacter malonaticus]